MSDPLLEGELHIPADRESWLEARKIGIGGSEAAAAVGLSPWKSQLALWAEKSGLVERENLDEVEYVEWGSILENPISEKYVKKTGRTLIDHGRYAIRRSEPWPWMHCTIDREIMPIDDRGPGSLSIKNAGEFKRKDWEEEPPLPYQIQLQHELAVTGWRWGSFAVLIGGNKFHWCDVERNDEFILWLVEKEREFCERVRTGNPPDPDASDSTRELLARLYPKDTGASVDLPPEAEQWADAVAGAKSAIKAAEATKQQFENLLKAAIGDAAIGLLPDGSGFSWKMQHRDSYTVAACDFRVLRQIKGKK